MKKLSKEDLDIFFKEWNTLKENHHDKKLEKVFDSLNLEIDYYDYICDRHEKDFEVEYMDDPEDIYQHYCNMKILKILFDHDFKYIILSNKSKLYKDLNNYQNIRHRVLRSPECNICGHDRNNLTIFIENDKFLYCYIGCSYYKNTTTKFFSYLGEIKK